MLNKEQVTERRQEIIGRLSELKVAEQKLMQSLKSVREEILRCEGGLAEIHTVLGGEKDEPAS